MYNNQDYLLQCEFSNITAYWLCYHTLISHSDAENRVEKAGDSVHALKLLL
jgi:hypothetical protein